MRKVLPIKSEMETSAYPRSFYTPLGKFTFPFRNTIITDFQK